MKRLKENLISILLIITIIVCTVCICKKISRETDRIDNIYDAVNHIQNLNEETTSNVKTLYYKFEDTNKYLKNIDLTLDGSLEDILYYMPKAR